MEVASVTSRSKFINHLCLSFILLFFTITTSAKGNITTLPKQNTTTIIIGSSLTYPVSTKRQDGYLDLIYKEAFSRMGVNLQINHLPSERSLRNANKGIIDGDILRVGNISNLYPNLIKVPEKIIDMDFVAFTNSVKFSTTHWEKIQPFSIGLIRGWKIFEINTDKAKTVTKVRDADLLFKLLKKNRIDIALYERFEGYGKIKQLDLKGFYTLEPPLASKKMFLYLNKKHAHLIPKLVIIIKEMKQDGTFKKIHKSTLTMVMPKKKSF